MNFLFDPANLILAVLSLGLLVLKAWALIDCIQRPATAFEIQNKQSKPIWLGILGVTLLMAILFPSVLGIFSIIGAIAAIVYLVDVKPAVSGSTNPWA